MCRYRSFRRANPFFLVFGLFILLYANRSIAQKMEPSFSHQLSMITENDRYMFKGKDGYYTNGIILRYTKALALTRDGKKRLHHFELGQKIFMPHSRKIYVPVEIDRPVTGYLYLKFNRSVFSRPNSLWQWGVSVDVIGDASGARAVQNRFHNWINVNSSWWGWVWDYQLKNGAGLNLHGQFAKALLSGNRASWFQMIPISKATAGITFTTISQGVVLQFGRLCSLSQSAYWDAVPSPIAATDKKSEWALFYHPELLYQVYNATLQGSFFRNDKGPITDAPEPLVLTQQAGILFSGARYQVRLAANFQTREAKRQLFTHSYGSVQAAYRFR